MVISRFRLILRNLFFFYCIRDWWHFDSLFDCRGKSICQYCWPNFVSSLLRCAYFYSRNFDFVALHLAIYY